jgi:N utilization substance protein A
MDQVQAEVKQQSEVSELVNVFMAKLDVDEDVASVLVAEGFTSIEEMVYVPMQELLDIEDFSEETVQELRDRARDALLIDAISIEENSDNKTPAQDLLDLEGMDGELAVKLAAAGIITAEDLAECGIDELLDIEKMSKELAGQLIMKAREPWFAETTENE